MFKRIAEFLFGKPRSVNTHPIDAIIKIASPTATTLAEKAEDDINNITNHAPDKHKAHAEEAPATPKAAKPKVAKPRAKKQGS